MPAGKKPKPKDTPKRPGFQLNLRVSTVARDMLERIADKHGFNLTHALEYAIRQTARHEEVWDIKPKH